jgi:predicted naringenin-chalcone synthase
MNEYTPRILGIGTALPASVEQSRIAAIAAQLIDGSDDDRAALERVFSRCGVERRGVALIDDRAPREGEAPAELAAQHEASSDARLRSAESRIGMGSPGASSSRGESSARVDDRAFHDLTSLERFYTPADPPSTAIRMAAFARLAPPLAERSARAAIDDAQLDPRAVTHLVTVSCTGFVSPGVDAHLVESLGLRRDVSRVNIGFMGCHAAINALAVARSIARADSDARVLVACVELCSLHLSYGRSMEKIVANALFADGAASVVVGQSDDASRWELVSTSSQLLPVDTRADMGWTIGDVGFEMTLSPRVPEMVESGIRAWCDDWLGRAGSSVETVERWAIHPGGPKVLTSAARGLGIEPSQVEVSRDVLREHGNMSSTTVLFILERLASTTGDVAMLAFGPGLTMEGALLRRVTAR